MLAMLDDFDRAGERWMENDGVVHTDEDASSNEFSTVELDYFRHGSIGISGFQKGKGSQ